MLPVNVYIYIRTFCRVYNSREHFMLFKLFFDTFITRTSIVIFVQYGYRRLTILTLCHYVAVYSKYMVNRRLFDEPFSFVYISINMYTRVYVLHHFYSHLYTLHSSTESNGRPLPSDLVANGMCIALYLFRVSAFYTFTICV